MAKTAKADGKTALEYIPIDALKAYARNTRTHSDAQVEQLKRSITEFGFTNPVLVDEENVLIAGHGRTEAARALGMKEVPAIRLRGLTEAQRKALRIADNQLALNAGWDWDMLKVELTDLDQSGFALDGLGFDLDEIEGLLDRGTPQERPRERPPQQPSAYEQGNNGEGSISSRKVPNDFTEITPTRMSHYCPRCGNSARLFILSTSRSLTFFAMAGWLTSTQR